MALSECPDCGGKVSEAATACPHCGRPSAPSNSQSPKSVPPSKQPKKGSSVGKIGCLSIIGLFGFLMCFGALIDEDSGSTKTSQEEKASEKPKTPEELRAEKIQNLFSSWDGSLRALEKMVKSSMNDPDSYEHVETVYWDMGDHLVVRTTFRGKNGFGGVVKNWVKAKVALDGSVTEIMEQGS